MSITSPRTSRALKGLRITKLSLINWRNFKSAEVTLGGRAFIIGANASGKSNLLDALRFLRDIAKPTGGLAAALAAPHRRSFREVRCLEGKNPSHIGIDIEVGTDQEPSIWTYALRLQQRKNERVATVEKEEITHRGEIVGAQHRPKNNDDFEIYAQCLLQQATSRQKFLDLVQFLNSIRYLHVVPQIVRDARRHLAEIDDPYGGDLLRRINEMPEKSRKPRLQSVEQALAIAVPQFKKLTLESDADGRPHLWAAYDHWRAHASRQSEEVFSDGALRMIGLLWSITEGGGPLLLEEPELSLHDAVVQQLPGMIQRARRLSGRQVIATTHSAAMLDVGTISANEVHRIDVSKGWSVIKSGDSDPTVAAQIAEGHFTVGQAMLPLTMPQYIEQLGKLNVASD